MTERILTDWLGAECAAFRLSNGRIVQIPAEDYDRLAHELFALAIARDPTRRFPRGRSFALDGAGVLVEAPAPCPIPVLAG